MGIKTFTVGVGLPVLLLCAASATAQGARLNPCLEYQGYVDAGNADSLMAQSFQKVCETVGHIELTNDCMTYYSFVNSFGEDSPMTQARAEACEASMPGLREQVAAGPVPAPSQEPVADSGADGGADTGGDTMVAQVEEQAIDQTADQGGIQMAEPVDDGPGSDADIAFWDTVKNSESADMYAAYLNIYPDGMFAPIARVRMQELQSQPETAPEPEPQVATQETQPQPEPVDEASGSAAEIAFWNSVKDSGSVPMLQTYLDAYPSGLFAPIALLKIEALQLPDEPEQPVVDEVMEEPVEDSQAAATELAVWNSVKDSGSPEMLDSYLQAYPDGTFAPIARVMMDRLAQDAAPVVEEQPAAQKDTKAPKTPAQLFKRGERLMGKAANATGDEAKKFLKRARRNYRKAAEGGHVQAMMKLAAMQAQGQGGGKDIVKAAKTYVEAGRKGQMDGYEQALILLDDNGREARVVDVLVEFYKKRPKRAVDLLNTLSDKSIIAVQRMLKKQGYYFAALDADFGPLSEKALGLFARGAPKPKVKVVKKYTTTVKVVKVSPLAAKLQRQLKRVWCYRGPIDGVWGAGSRHAMHNFNRWMGTGYATGHPTAAAYNRVRNTRRPVCGVD
jgi:TPR repeat protein